MDFQVVDNGYVMTGLDVADKMAADVAAASTARPTLVNVPGETTGQSTVHYVMDKEAQAQVQLYRLQLVYADNTLAVPVDVQ